MNIVFLNDQFLAENEAKVSVADRGFLLGDGLFETIRIYNGQALFLAQHLLRLSQSARILEIPFHFTEKHIKNIIEKLLEKNKFSEKDAIIRITLTRGASYRGLAFPDIQNPTLLIAVFPYSTHHEGCCLITSAICRNEFSFLSHLKSLNYLESILAYQAAIKQNKDDALMLNTQGQVASTTCANIFIVKDNVILTPKISDGVLPGVMRHLILQLAPLCHMEIYETSIPVQDLKSAHEVFITNAVQGIRSVIEIDDFYTQNGEGKVTLQLKNALQEKIK